MSLLSEKTQALKDAVDSYEQALAAVAAVRALVEQAHKDVADLLTSNPLPTNQEQQ